MASSIPVLTRPNPNLSYTIHNRLSTEKPEIELSITTKNQQQSINNKNETKLITKI